MHKRVFITTMALGMFLVLNSVQAQMMGSGPEMMEDQQQAIKARQQKFQNMRYHDMMDEYGYGPGMMGYGPGMMGGYGPGMMHGYGMGYGMMGDHHGMGWGMMGGQGFCQGPMNLFEYGSDQYNEFMNETRDTRKKLHDMRFEYGEMQRNPKSTIADLKDMQKKMYELQKELMEKAFAEE